MSDDHEDRDLKDSAAAAKQQLERLLQKLDEAQTVAILRERLASLDRGEPGIPAEQALDDIRKALGLDRPRGGGS